MPTRDAITWFKGQFQKKIEAAIAGTPFTTDLLTALACQETGYLWDILRRRQPVERVLELCVGYTIDFTPPNKGRKAFPKNKAELVAHPQGQAMFAIGRKALEEMAQYIPTYQSAAAKPEKFCHGYGIFQYDLQHFKTDPVYFLEKRWVDFDNCLRLVITELQAAQRRARLQDKDRLSDLELCHVAIAYNRGSFDPAKGLKQGFKSSDGKYYGENIQDFLQLSQRTPAPASAPTAPAAPPSGSATLPSPTLVEASGKTYRVDVQTHPLRMRSSPEIPPNNPTRNVIGLLPAGLLVRALTNQPQGGFLDVETNLRGAHLRGWVSLEHLAEVAGSPEIPVSAPASTAAKPPIPEVHAPRGSTAITRRRDPATAHSLNEPGQPKRRGLTPAALCDELHAIIAWLDVENPQHARYRPTQGLTFCNIYAHDYCHLAGVYLPRVWWTSAALLRLSRGESVEPRLGQSIEEQRANSLYGWLRDFGLDFGWRQTGTLTKLQDAANQGAVCLIVARRRSDGPPGHVTVVAPEIPAQVARRNATGEVIAPLQSQAGSRNFRLSTSTANWWLDQRFAYSAFWIHA
ncbi:MAG: hypothetical protein EOM21_18090 [Gammaproteobacteria bacterium]|nr:hypothetical protein [Gammaproteobacteria bacterium]